MSRFIASILPLSLVLSACAHLGAPRAEHRRAVVVSLDGAAAEVIGRALAAGWMPNLARIKGRGAWPQHSRTNFPSKTAAGHAALWTGAMSDVNGIAGNKVLSLPLHARTILELDDGFSSDALLAEPIWVTAARAGKRALVLQGTHVTPIATYEPGGRFGGPFAGSLTLLDGYAGVLAKDGVHQDASAWRPAQGWNEPIPGASPLEQRLQVAGRPWWALAYDDPADPVVGYDSVALVPHKAAPWAVLKPGSWSTPVRIEGAKGPGWLRFHLFDLAPDLSSWRLYHTGVSAPVSNQAEAPAVWYGPETPFVPQGPGRLWAKGLLGPTIFQGGDGQAEARYVTIVRHIMGGARLRLERLMARRDWDLAVCYLPYPDEALHHWYGGLAPGARELPGRLWGPQEALATARLADVLRAVDDTLAPLAGAPDTVVALASDHGMAPTPWAFHPNAVLRKAGLLVLTRAGQVDLARTKALYTGTDGGYVVVNHVGHKGGIVKRSDVPAVLARVEAALTAERDSTGRQLVSRFILRDSPEAVSLGIGGPRAGDLYLDLQPGYIFDAEVAAPHVVSRAEAGRAGHVFDPRRADMHAFMALAGPGVRQGVELPPVTNADLAPTLARLLGIPAPAHATGRPIAGALAAAE
jgi:predicted AlkP superfamily pyrophosphatase or phosphodiesterase